MTFYRIQPAGRDLDALLDESTWQSKDWNDPWSEPRYGVSVCDDIDTLVEYFRIAGGYVDEDMVLVTLHGYRADEQDHDHERGAILIRPIRVVSAVPVPADIIARIDEE